MKPLIVYHLMFKNVEGGIHTMVSTLASAMAASSGAALFRVGHWDEAQWQCSQEGDLTFYNKRLRMPWDSVRPLRGVLAWLWEFPQTWRQLLHLLRSEKIQVIHLHGLYDHQLIFLLLARYMGIPCVLTLHGSEILKFDQRTPMQQRLNRWLLRRVDGIACVSEQVLKALNLHMPDVVGHCIENGIDVDAVKDLSQRALPASLPPLPERYCLLVGHITPVKGHDIAVAAWHKVVEVRPDLHLVIVGRSVEEEFNRKVQEIAGLGAVKERIHFLGALPTEQLLPILKGAMALLIPSRSEGLPYVLLEAGALEKPLIVSAIPPFIDLFNGVECCHVFAKEDVAALANIVIEKSDNPEELLLSGRKLAQAVHNDFSAGQMVAKYQGLYRQSTDKN
jgi:glycosyltransferase involved in cell wall biosynthesis